MPPRRGRLPAPGRATSPAPPTGSRSRQPESGTRWFHNKWRFDQRRGLLLARLALAEQDAAAALEAAEPVAAAAEERGDARYAVLGRLVRATAQARLGEPVDAAAADADLDALAEVAALEGWWLAADVADATGRRTPGRPPSGWPTTWPARRPTAARRSGGRSRGWGECLEWSRRESALATTAPFSDRPLLNHRPRPSQHRPRLLNHRPRPLNHRPATASMTSGANRSPVRRPPRPRRRRTTPGVVGQAGRERCAGAACPSR